MYMLHHYLQRGILPEKIINLPISEKLFYRASMDVWISEENEKYKALMGS